jgi:hypothetical protein
MDRLRRVRVQDGCVALGMCESFQVPPSSSCLSCEDTTTTNRLARRSLFVNLYGHLLRLLGLHLLHLRRSHDTTDRVSVVCVVAKATIALSHRLPSVSALATHATDAQLGTMVTGITIFARHVAGAALLAFDDTSGVSGQSGSN